MLPSRSALTAEIGRAGLTLAGSIEFADSYSQTLRRWHEAFNKMEYSGVPIACSSFSIMRSSS